jgi:PKD repeat protein
LSQTTYYYVIAGSANCSDTTAALEVFITNILPTASFTQTSQDLTVTFTATVSSGVNAYSWDFGDSQSASEPNPVHTYAAEGTYSVCLTVNNGPLCSFTKCNDISVSVTGIDKSSRHVSWMVYPNPMNEILLLRGSNLKTIKAIECYDAAGRMVFGKTSIQVMDETIQMNVSMLERGIYFLKIKTDDFESTRQLIKFQE